MIKSNKIIQLKHYRIFCLLLFYEIFNYKTKSIALSIYIWIFSISRSEFWIINKQTPTESHNSWSSCKRNHSIIIKVYNKLKSEIPNQEKHLTLRLAVHAHNNNAGLEVSYLPYSCLETYREYLFQIHGHFF